MNYSGPGEAHPLPTSIGPKIRLGCGNMIHASILFFAWRRPNEDSSSEPEVSSGPRTIKGWLPYLSNSHVDCHGRLARPVVQPANGNPSRDDLK
jgi:hypothetical protein